MESNNMGPLLSLLAWLLLSSGVAAAAPLQTNLPCSSSPPKEARGQQQAKPTGSQPPPSPAQPATVTRLSLEDILARLPGRVTTKSGRRGDMVNFLLIGSRSQVAAALEAAGWVPVDQTTEQAITHAINDVLAHRAYSQLPMSPLYLFGRPQDFGYAQGIPLHIIAERDHFRLWKAPWETCDGRTVWVGAGTHDLYPEKASVGGQLAHAIDPNVDKERDYIAQTLSDAAKIQSSQYLAPAHPVLRAETATGAPYHSDGRILVVFLK